MTLPPVITDAGCPPASIKSGSASSQLGVGPQPTIPISDDAQFAGSSSVPAHVEMMGLIGAGNNPMVGMTVAVAVAIEQAAAEGKF